MNIVQTYTTIYDRVSQVVEKERVTRLRTMAWLQSGILHSRSVYLTRIASKLPSRTKKLSSADRFRSFLNNSQVRVREWYHPIAEDLINESVRTSGRVRLIIDGSKIGSKHQLIMVAIAYRRRALPLAWTWVRAKRGHSSGRKQCALLDYIHRLIPPNTEVIVVGDSEFTPLQTILANWGWFYALRHKGSHQLRQNDSDEWKRIDSLVAQPGQRLWLADVILTKTNQIPCNFFALWRSGEKEPWLIATNLPTERETRLHYSRRMWIEEMFGDFKRHGFDLEASRLRHFLRLSRLTLAVSMLYVMVVTFGSQTIKNGLRNLVDRNDRRDLSIFRIGFDMLERCLALGKMPSIRLIPYFL